MGREVTFTNNRNQEGTDTSSIRIVHSKDWLGAQVLGFHETTDWVPPGARIIADSPMDTWGSCTITISCKALAGNSPGRVSTTRRRTILKVIPASTQEHSTKPYIYERFGPRYGHKISTRCIGLIDLSLLDDLGCPMDPRHHWCVGLEVYAIKHNKKFMHIM
jgi:hypothetical protein